MFKFILTAISFALLTALFGCEDFGTLAYTSTLDEQPMAGIMTPPVASETPAPVRLSGGDFLDAFTQLIAQSGRSLVAADSANANERAYRVMDAGLDAEYADGFTLHLYEPDGNAESVTLTMPLPELADEGDIPEGDDAALEALRRSNEARKRERAAFAECAEAAIRAANQYMNGFSEAEILLAMSRLEKTLSRGSEQAMELSGAAARSFALAAGEAPRIVFTLEFGD